MASVKGSKLLNYLVVGAALLAMLVPVLLPNVW